MVRNNYNLFLAGHCQAQPEIYLGTTHCKDTELKMIINWLLEKKNLLFHSTSPLRMSYLIPFKISRLKKLSPPDLMHGTKSF